MSYEFPFCTESSFYLDLKRIMVRRFKELIHVKQALNYYPSLLNVFIIYLFNQQLSACATNYVRCDIVLLWENCGLNFIGQFVFRVASLRSQDWYKVSKIYFVLVSL